MDTVHFAAVGDCYGMACNKLWTGETGFL